MTKFPRSPRGNRLSFLTAGGVIGGMYLCLCLLFPAISYGPIQVRVAEVLWVLPLFTPAAIPGLTVGCLLSNLFGGGAAGGLDWLFGTAATLLSAVLTYRFRRLPVFLTLFIPVVLNGLTVGAEIAFAAAEGFSVLLFFLYAAEVAAGEFLACVGGAILWAVLKKSGQGQGDMKIPPF